MNPENSVESSFESLSHEEKQKKFEIQAFIQMIEPLIENPCPESNDALLCVLRGQGALHDKINALAQIEKNITAIRTDLHQCISFENPIHQYMDIVFAELGEYRTEKTASAIIDYYNKASELDKPMNALSALSDNGTDVANDFLINQMRVSTLENYHKFLIPLSNAGLLFDVEDEIIDRLEKTKDFNQKICPQDFGVLSPLSRAVDVLIAKFRQERSNTTLIKAIVALDMPEPYKMIWDEAEYRSEAFFALLVEHSENQFFVKAQELLASSHISNDDTIMLYRSLLEKYKSEQLSSHPEVEHVAEQCRKILAQHFKKISRLCMNMIDKAENNTKIFTEYLNLLVTGALICADQKRIKKELINFQRKMPFSVDQYSVEFIQEINASLQMAILQLSC